MQRPKSSEYPEYYHSYVNNVEDEDLIPGLLKNQRFVNDYFEQIPEDRWNDRYETNKWSVREVLAHINDVERMMSNRALRIGRNDKTPIQGFDHNAYVEINDYNHLSKDDLIKEFNTVRNASYCLFKNLPKGAETNTGIANELKINVRSLGFIILGHAIHHINVLKERYKL